MNITSPRVILVGCGGIARAHAAAVGATVGAANIVALCDANLDVARQLQRDLGLNTPLYRSLEKALTAHKPEVAIVCTPPTTHYELVQMALQNGADVLCEKPLATRANDARALVELADNNQRRLRTSAKYRFDAGVCAAKSRLDSGETGALHHLKIAFGAHFDYTRSWHANRELSGGGVWMDNGPHALDLARFFVGDLKVNSIVNWHCQGDLETEVAVSLRGAGGVGVAIELSWQRALGQWLAQLECERGVLSVGWRCSQWQPFDGQTQIIAGGYDKTAAFGAQWRGFVNGDARFEAADGARTVELLEAAIALV